jgi:hypothetical protein
MASAPTSAPVATTLPSVLFIAQSFLWCDFVCLDALGGNRQNQMEFQCRTQVLAALVPMLSTEVRAWSRGHAQEADLISATSHRGFRTPMPTVKVPSSFYQIFCNKLLGTTAPRAEFIKEFIEAMSTSRKSAIDAALCN